LAVETFLQLKSRLMAEGFDYLQSDEIGDYINDGYLRDICEVDNWPFLEASTSGAAPLTVSDLRVIESVVDTTTNVKLLPMDRRTITDTDTDLTTTGTPFAYYIAGGTAVTTFPASTNTLSVRYWKVPTALSSDSDEPLIPSRFRSLIVDAAKVRAYENDDESEMADAARARFDARLQEMRASLTFQQHDRPDQWMVTTWELDAWGGV
jgi:hypothetical protein